MNDLLNKLDRLPPDIKKEFIEVGLLASQKRKIERMQKDFMLFVKHVWPEFIEGKHHQRIAEKFNLLAEGKIKRLIINMPPRHTKSEFASFLLPCVKSTMCEYTLFFRIKSLKYGKTAFFNEPLSIPTDKGRYSRILSRIVAAVSLMSHRPKAISLTNHFPSSVNVALTPVESIISISPIIQSLQRTICHLLKALPKRRVL